MAISVQDYEELVVLDELEKLLERNDGQPGPTSRFDNTQPPARSHASEMMGQRVGPYQVIETLGQGGMGVVYLAQDTRLARKAALKAILPGAEHDSMALERLRSEARVLASLSHPNRAIVYGSKSRMARFFSRWNTSR